jgi:sulfate adenylyltransferase large subunit
MSEQQLLRFFTAGSVDDGKSTLIGRLLFEARGVYEDQLASIANSSLNRSSGPIDFSLLTDGLRAEREQGITIDVAYRYFSTPRRKFIIADTPGHEQYTRNMATGASTAELAIILIDARKGVLPQSRRHGFISALLGIRYIMVAVNKMDLVDFSQDVFESIKSEFDQFAREVGMRSPIYFPISALEGDNIIERSPRTPWYIGPPVLEFLEEVPIEDSRNFEDLRFPIQYVIRPDLDFRGYAGQLASGVVRPGDRVMALPSGRVTRVKSLPSYEGELAEAFPPMSITICLEEEIDLSRGDMLCDPKRIPHVARRFDASLVWMLDAPGYPGKTYLLKHTTQTVPAEIVDLKYLVEVNTLSHLPASELKLNDIAQVTIETRRPIFFDSYKKHRATGCFILVDPVTNLTVAAGMIDAPEVETAETGQRRSHLDEQDGDIARVSPGERFARSRHFPAVLWLHARQDLAYRLERRLFEAGCQVHALTEASQTAVAPSLALELNRAGFLVLCAFPGDTGSLALALAENPHFFPIDPGELPGNEDQAVEKIVDLLRQNGILSRQ